MHGSRWRQRGEVPRLEMRQTRPWMVRQLWPIDINNSFLVTIFCTPPASCTQQTSYCASAFQFFFQRWHDPSPVHVDDSGELDLIVDFLRSAKLLVELKPTQLERQHRRQTSEPQLKQELQDNSIICWRTGVCRLPSKLMHLTHPLPCVCGSIHSN